MAKTYSKKLTAEQNAALARYEALTGYAPFALDELERGVITATQLWDNNIAWIVGVANDAQHIQFPS